MFQCQTFMFSWMRQWLMTEAEWLQKVVVSITSREGREESSASTTTPSTMTTPDMNQTSTTEYASKILEIVKYFFLF